jgi:hypothetical protein
VITIGIPIIKDLITFPLVAIQIKATGTTKLANSPSGIKLIPGRIKDAIKDTGINNNDVTRIEGIPNNTATSNPI